MKNFITLNVTMEKIRNIITIRRVLKCSFALLLIAGKLPFLTAIGKNYIFMDFKEQAITQAGVLEKIQEYKKEYIKECKHLIGKFREFNESGSTRSGTDLIKGYIKPFYEFVFSNELDPQVFEQYRDYFGGGRDAQDKGLEMAKFFLAFKALKSGFFDKDTKKCEEDLHAELTKFIDIIKKDFEGLETLDKDIQDNAVVKELRMNFVLFNGIVSAKTSRELFETSPELFECFQKPFNLTFLDVKGEFCASKQLKRSVVTMRFIKSQLKFVECCFKEAPLLKELDATEKTSDLICGKESFANCPNLEDIKVVNEASFFEFGKNSFSGCPKLQSPFRADNNIRVMGFVDRLLDAFGGFEKDEGKRKSVTKAALSFYYDCVQDGSFRNLKKAYGYLVKNDLNPSHLVPLYDVMLKEAKSENESLKKKNDKLQKENTRLKKSNKTLYEDLEAEERPVMMKNKELKESIKEKDKELEKTSKELLKRDERIAQLKKIIEEKEKELEESGKNWDQERLRRLQLVDKNRELRDKIKALEEEKEELEEEISILKAYKEEWKDKIETIPALKEEKEQLKNQLTGAIREMGEPKRMMEQERAKNKAALKKKNQEIAELEKKLEKKDTEISELKAIVKKKEKEVKEMKTSEALILATMGMLNEGAQSTKDKGGNQTSASRAQNINEEEPKEEVTEETSQKEKEEPFYPKNGQKGGNQTSASRAQNINKEEPKEEVTEETSQRNEEEPRYSKKSQEGGNRTSASQAQNKNKKAHKKGGKYRDVDDNYFRFWL